MKVTKQQLKCFFGDNTIDSICDYLPTNLNLLQDGKISIQDFIDSFIPYNYETMMSISNHFFLALEDIRDDNVDMVEQYSIKIDASRWTPIEWCEENSETVKDLGKDCFSRVKYKGKTYYWRWL